MNISKLLDICEQKRIVLWFEGDRLRFRSPEGAMDAELKKQLSENKLEILETLRNKAGRQIIRHPLSYAQQALWFLWRAVPQASAYNVTFTAKINSVFESKTKQNFSCKRN